MFKLGLIINPLAGIGGPLALKGSDGEAIVSRALQEGPELRAQGRAKVALAMVATLKRPVKVYCYRGVMGGDVAQSLGFDVEFIGSTNDTTSAADTIAAAEKLREMGVDLILFAGGDGTARDICRAVGDSLPTLGVPAGVKMHSGVYAITPQSAGELVAHMLIGKLVDIGLAEVRDIDEEAFRKGVVRSRFYGELLVPREGHFLQQVKSSGREVEALVLQDIGADIVESMSDDCLYLIGPGTTPKAIMDELGLDNTLLGIDAILAGNLIGADLSERKIIKLLDEHKGASSIVITAIGGQGHIIGRGNQQLSPVVLRRVGIENIIVVATKTKITELAGRPLLVDSNDEALDEEMTGYRTIVTGYHDAIVYPVGINIMTEKRDGAAP